MPINWFKKLARQSSCNHDYRKTATYFGDSAVWIRTYCPFCEKRKSFTSYEWEEYLSIQALSKTMGLMKKIPQDRE